MSETDWTRFRVETMTWPTFLKRNLIHADLLRAVLRRARGSVLEVGIGSGAQSSILSRFVDRTISIDNDWRILTAAGPNLARFGPGVIPVAADAFALPFPYGTFGVAVSQGLMEHFEDDWIGRLLREQLRACRSVVFSVPSIHYPRQDVGDERLMSSDEWAEVVRGVVDTGSYTVRARYYRFDPETFKYSVLARRRLGGFSVLVTIDPN